MTKKQKIMIYGANGYSAQLILEEILKHTIKPILAGRNKEAAKKIAEKNNLMYRVFDLSNIENITKNLEDVHVLLNCAGPFYQTASKLIDACLSAGTNYLDITGEMEVFDYGWGKNNEAKEKGIVIMSGAGFDVIPTDCLAKKLKEEMPDAVKLQLGFAPMKSMPSRGTVKSVITHFNKDIIIRQNGELKYLPIGTKSREIDFGDFKSTAMALQWADVYNAYYSTSIPDIEAYAAVPKSLIFLTKAFAGLLTSSFIKNILLKFAETFLTGPGKSQREKSFSYIWGSVEDKKGSVIEHVYLFPDGYSLTAVAAAECVIRIFNNEAKAGTQTPSLAFGSSFMDRFVIRKIK